VRTATRPASSLIGLFVIGSFVTVKRHLLRLSSFFLLSTQLTSGISVIRLVKPNSRFFLYFTIPTTTHTANTISQTYVPVWTRHEIYVLVLHSTHHSYTSLALHAPLALLHPPIYTHTTNDTIVTTMHQ
jgi:hypothetical protein